MEVIWSSPASDSTAAGCSSDLQPVVFLIYRGLPQSFKTAVPQKRRVSVESQFKVAMFSLVQLSMKQSLFWGQIARSQFETEPMESSW